MPRDSKTVRNLVDVGRCSAGQASVVQGKGGFAGAQAVEVADVGVQADLFECAVDEVSQEAVGE
jgi:hypothetical protein